MTEQQANRFFYVLLSAILLGVALIAAIKEFWVYDFWDYASIIRELRDHPLNPTDTFVRGENTLVPYWPYLFAASVISSLTSLTPAESLATLGIFNVLLLLFSMRLFARQLLGSTESSFLAIIFILFLWGDNLWFQSNFFHAEVFPVVVSYPATFAFSCSLLVVVFFQRGLERASAALVTASSMLLLLALLAHPITSIFGFTGVLAIVLTRDRAHLARSALAGSFCVTLPLLCGALWPIFPLFEGLLSTGHLSSTGARMYTDVLERILPPLVVGLPALVISWVRFRQRYLAVHFCLLLGLYVVAGLLGMGSFGRVISFWVICLQIATALVLTSALYASSWSSVRLRHGVYAVCISLPAWYFIDSTWLDPRYYNSCRSFQPFQEHFSRTDVILAPPHVANCFPSMGPRVVALAGAGPFFPRSFAERMDDVSRFYDPSLSMSLRGEIIKKYGVTLVLSAPSFRQLLSPLGLEMVAETESDDRTEGSNQYILWSARAKFSAWQEQSFPALAHLRYERSGHHAPKEALTSD